MQSEVIYLTREGDKVNYSGTNTWLLVVARGTVQVTRLVREVGFRRLCVRLKFFSFNSSWSYCLSRLADAILL